MLSSSPLRIKSVSSSPLLSPTSLLRIPPRPRRTAAAAANISATCAWEVPDSQSEGELSPAPPPKPKARRKAAKTGEVVMGKPGGRPRKVNDQGANMAPKTVNKQVKAGTKSKYFVTEEERLTTAGSEEPKKKTARRKAASAAHVTTEVSKTTGRKAATKASGAVAEGSRKRTKEATSTTAKKSVAPRKKAGESPEPVLGMEVVPETPKPIEQSTPPSSPPVRRQWTPARDTIPSPTDPETAIPCEDTEQEPTQLSFSDRIDAFQYRSVSVEELSIRANQQDAGPKFVKKRRIEMIDLPNPRPNPAPKAKKAKKKAPTITERATAKYRKGETANTPITQHFAVSKKPGAVSGKPAPLNLKANTKRKRKEEDIAFELMSPNSAKRRISAQGFVFGTCSQLEREDDTEESERSVPSLVSDGSREGSGSTELTDLDGVKRGAGLWGAANRDLDGGLLKGDVADMVDGKAITAGEDDSFLGMKTYDEYEDNDSFVLAQMSTPALRERDHRQSDSRLSEITLDLGKNDDYEDIDSLLSREKRSVVQEDSKSSEYEDIDTIVPKRGYTNKKPDERKEGYEDVVSKPHRMAGAPTRRQNNTPTHIESTLSESRTNVTTIDLTLSPFPVLQKAATPLTLSDPPRSPGSRSSEADEDEVSQRLKDLLPVHPQMKSTASGKRNSPKPSVDAAPAPRQRKTSRARSTAPSEPPPPLPATSSSEGPQMPDFSAFPTNRLQIELQKFGFKKIGSRAAMISCMEKCWLAQHPPAPLPPPAQEVPPTRPPSRGKTATTTTTTKRGRSRSASADPSVSNARTRRVVRDNEELAELHLKISEAIKLAAKPDDAKSWHFKILMYDPIVLEDLTTWLNTVGLKSVGVNDEVRLGETKVWCDMKGICCLSRETQRGLVRKRY